MNSGVNRWLPFIPSLHCWTRTNAPSFDPQCGGYPHRRRIDPRRTRHREINCRARTGRLAAASQSRGRLPLRVRSRQADHLVAPNARNVLQRTITNCRSTSGKHPLSTCLFPRPKTAWWELSISNKPSKKANVTLNPACWPTPTADCYTLMKSTCSTITCGCPAAIRRRWESMWSNAKVSPSRIPPLHPGRNHEPGRRRTAPATADRFALSVDIVGIREARERVMIMERTSRSSRTPRRSAKLAEKESEISKQIERARELLDQVKYTSRDLLSIAALTASLNVDGHRADLVILKAARAQAAFEGRHADQRHDIALRRNWPCPTASSARRSSSGDHLRAIAGTHPATAGQSVRVNPMTNRNRRKASPRKKKLKAGR